MSLPVVLPRLETHDFDFDSGQLTVIAIDDKPWFVATEVSLALGYSRSDKLSTNIRDRWRGFTTKHVRVVEGPTLKAIKSLTPNSVVSANARHLMLLSREGVNLAAIKADTAEGERLQLWLADTVLPAIQDKGVFELPGARQRAIDEAERRKLELREQKLKLEERRLEVRLFDSQRLRARDQRRDTARACRLAAAQACTAEERAYFGRLAASELAGQKRGHLRPPSTWVSPRDIAAENELTHELVVQAVRRYQGDPLYSAPRSDVGGAWVYSPAIVLDIIDRVRRQMTLPFKEKE